MCSVNVFGIITGYLYAGKEKHSSYSIIKLLVAFGLYSVLVTFVIQKLYPESIHGKVELIKNLFPFGIRLWYITAYVFVFFMIPYMNNFISGIDKKIYIRFLIILALLLCVVSQIRDFFGISMGYSCWWLIFCYFVGAYVKIFGIELKRCISIIMFIGSCLILFAVNICTQILNTVFIDKIFDRLIAYTSPFVVINSISIFLFFKTIEVRKPRIRSILKICSGSALAVYIIHAHGLFLDNILYPLMPVRLENNPFRFFAFGVMIVFGVFIAGILIDVLRLKIEYLIKIDSLYKKVSSRIDSVLLWNCEK